MSRLSVRDLVLIAALAAVGGAMSAYVGYLGNLINRFLGVPFGAGQILAGLHVIWPLLAVGLTRRTGAGTLTGLVKGAVELLMGGTHGVVILLVSAIQGTFVDLGLALSPRQALWAFLVAGTASAASNVFVFQAIYFSGVPAAYILFMAALAAVSGLVLGGWLAHDLLGALHRAGLARSPVPATGRGRTWAALGLALALIAGGGNYYLQVWEPLGAPGEVRIEGEVARPLVFRHAEWAGKEITVEAELRGAVTHVPARPYTGVPLAAVLAEAEPLPGASQVRVRASDGHEAAFPLVDVLEGEMLLVLEDGRTRLVAPGVHGASWVQNVVQVEVR